MTANDGKGNNSLRDMWETPRELFDDLNLQYKFDFDCCASYENKKCVRFASEFELMGEIVGVAWMNPPFSVAWRMFEHFFKVVGRGVSIYRADNFETALWQKIIFPGCDWVFIPDKRIEYKGLSNTWDRPVFPSALIGVGVPVPKGLPGTLLVVER